jgi:hypothetical protein
MITYNIKNMSNMGPTKHREELQLMSRQISYQFGPIDYNNDFGLETMFGSSSPPVGCRRASVFSILFVLDNSGVKHILSCVFVLLDFFLSWDPPNTGRNSN